MRRNESFFFALLAAIGALLLALMLLIGVWCSLRDAKEEIAAQQELIEDLKGIGRQRVLRVVALQLQIAHVLANDVLFVLSVRLLHNTCKDTTFS